MGDSLQVGDLRMVANLLKILLDDICSPTVMVMMISKWLFR
jgi:hypothetical protein